MQLNTNNNNKLSSNDCYLMRDLQDEFKKSEKFKLNKSYIEFLSSFDYRFSLAVTFNNDHSLKTSFEYFNKLLHFSNRKIFGKNYIKKNKFIDGFLFVEKQKSGRYHFHILITKNSNIGYDETDILDIFNECANRVTTRTGKSGYKVFGDRAFHFKDLDKDYFYKKGAIGYSSKELLRHNNKSIHPLTINGIDYIDEI